MLTAKHKRKDLLCTSLAILVLGIAESGRRLNSYLLEPIRRCAPMRGRKLLYLTEIYRKYPRERKTREVARATCHNWVEVPEICEYNVMTL